MFSLKNSVRAISHAFETAETTVFDAVVCKTPDAPLQFWLIFAQIWLPYGNSPDSLEILCSIFEFVDPENVTIYA